MNRREYPITTVTDGISIFDRDNQYRPLQWMDASNEIDWLEREDNGLLLTILEMLPHEENVFTNPLVNWTEDSRFDPATSLTAALTSSGTTLTVDDPYIAVVGTELISPIDGEIMEVTAVNYGSSQLTVTRGLNGTAAQAKSIGDYIHAMPAYMAEMSDPMDGVGRLPGDYQYNFISMASKSFKVTQLQDNSMVFDNWGQVPKMQIDTILDMRRELSNGLLFAARATRNVTNEGQLYISQGALNYNKDGFLDLGTDVANLTWPVLNSYLEGRFDPDASSQEKTLLAGRSLYNSAHRMMRDLGRLDEKPYWNPDLGARTFDIETDSGYVVHVLYDRYGLNADYGLGDWGFLFDMAHLSGAHYNGLEFQWFQNIQDNRSVLIREDTYLGSFSLVMKHQTTHGVVRGGRKNIVER